MVRIGSAKIETNVFLAPLAGCSDLAYRLIAREHGAKFCFFEMIDSSSIRYGPHRKTLSILNTIQIDKPIAAQVLGDDPAMMLAAAKKVLERVDVSFIDINAACPAKKVIKKGAGSYLLQNPASLYKIINKLALKLPLPVTVKIRLGFNDVQIGVITSTAKRCESAGASAIFVHGRTKVQGYAGQVDYASIKEIKESVKIPVFGSGNVFSPESAEMMFAKTGCDGIMVARGSLGNPWIFKHIENYIDKGTSAHEISTRTRKMVLKKHLSYIEKYKDISQSGQIGYMRKVALWYFKGFPNAKRIRHEISVVKDYEKMLKLIDSIGDKE